jgi:PadR family transcriptional regulator PadR
MHYAGTKGFLKPCLLLLLRERPDHGYDLVVRLAPLGLGEEESASVYRALRELEHEQLDWARPGNTPRPANDSASPPES